eukprot:TRINITY_DN16560_c0_g1_i1.p1 TRINITY_DN16560_c0_g1~~TRINITY_DN16560_c0_g1_i1.p1  ORF type:complete len:753 (+),score=134.58 TRINITY_DN16560_c0_g1_i1:90-2348(+)
MPQGSLDSSDFSDGSSSQGLREHLSSSHGSDGSSASSPRVEQLSSSAQNDGSDSELSLTVKYNPSTPGSSPGSGADDSDRSGALHGTPMTLTLKEDSSPSWNVAQTPSTASVRPLSAGDTPLDISMPPPTPSDKLAESVLKTDATDVLSPLTPPAAPVRPRRASVSARVLLTEEPLRAHSRSLAHGVTTPARDGARHRREETLEVSPMTLASTHPASASPATPHFPASLEARPLPPPPRAEVRIWGAPDTTLGIGAAKAAPQPAAVPRRVLKTPPRGHLGDRRPAARHQEPAVQPVAPKKQRVPREGPDIFEKMHKKAREKQAELREREEREARGEAVVPSFQQLGKGKKEKNAGKMGDAVKKAEARIVENRRKQLLEWVGAFVPGAEVRVIRRGMAVTPHPEKVFVKEGARGTVLSRKQRPKVRASAVVEVEDMSPLKVLMSSGQERVSTTLLTTDDRDPRPCSVHIWLSVGCTAMLVRADYLAVVNKADKEIERRDCVGPVLIGRQQVKAPKEAPTEGAPRPAWDVATLAPPRQVSALEEKFPIGCMVRLKGVTEPCKVTGYEGGRVVALIPSTFTLKAAATQELERVKGQIYAVQVNQGKDFTAEELDNIKKSRARKQEEVVLRAAGGDGNILSTKGKGAHDGKDAKKVLDTKQTQMLVSRLAAPLKCRDAEWADAEKRRLDKSEKERIEAGKRAANPTYAAMVQWREEWDRTNIDLYSDLASLPAEDCYEESTTEEAQELYSAYWRAR